MTLYKQQALDSATVYLSMHRIPTATAVALWCKRTNPWAGVSFALEVLKQAKRLHNEQINNVILGTL